VSHGWDRPVALVGAKMAGKSSGAQGIRMSILGKMKVGGGCGRAFRNINFGPMADGDLRAFFGGGTSESTKHKASEALVAGPLHGVCRERKT